MRIAHLNSFDALGGAARAATRIHRALRAAGHDSRMYVLERTGDDAATTRIVPSTWYHEIHRELGGSAYKALLYWHRPLETFSIDVDLLSSPTAALARHAAQADVLQVHWTRGLATARQVARVATRRGIPAVFTLMDLGPLTGGCHYTHGCLRYEQRCGRCPLLRSTREFDASRRNWRVRRDAFRSLPRLGVVACNGWTLERVRRSSLLADAATAVIPLPIDLDVFRPLPPALAREVLGVPRHGLVVFAGAADFDQPRKGFDYLADALHRVADELRRDAGAPPLTILTAGRRDVAARLPPGARVQHLGLLGDDRSLALAYAAADAFVSPSIEDAGPMMVNESLASGCPVVAFRIGTAADAVCTGANGALASTMDAPSLAQAILEVLRHPDPARLRAAARATAVESFAPAGVAARYAAFYATLGVPA